MDARLHGHDVEIAALSYTAWRSPRPVSLPPSSCQMMLDNMYGIALRVAQ
jgi:hypothetical protein